MPEIESSFRYFSQVSAIVFQSCGSMSSEDFMNGLSIIGLQISFSSGAIVRIVSLSVEMTPPDFGSSREEIVPPVIIIATLGRLESAGIWDLVLGICGEAFSMMVAFRISDSRIPML